MFAAPLESLIKIRPMRPVAARRLLALLDPPPQVAPGRSVWPKIFSSIWLAADCADSTIAEWGTPFGSVIETDYRDLVGQWKSRAGLDPARGIHQQLGLPRAKIPSRLLPHTKLMKWLRPLLLFPDDTKGWIEFATDAFAQLKNGDPVDAILSTFPPITFNLVAARAKQKFGVPWLADFRDLWSRDTLQGMRATTRFFTFSTGDWKNILTMADRW